MNTLLLEHFDQLISTPEDVERLNQSILDLAVRGKLTHQESSDEPAAELLKRIQKEKADLAARGELSNGKLFSPIAKSEIPFELPTGWEWARLSDLCYQITGGTHHTPQYIYDGVPFLSVKDVSSGRLDFSNTKFISQEAHEELIARCKPELGDVLLTKVGTTGIAVVVDTEREFSIFVSIALLKFFQNIVSPHYLALLINSPFVKAQSDKYTMGVGNKNLVLKHIKNFLIPLPPFVEQQRIVVRVEELFAQTRLLAEQLAHSRTELDRLNESALAHLLASRTPEEFDKRWGFIAEHFDLLTSAPEHIAPLRQSILELAVRGKLTRGEPGDEPAKELLKRIKGQKAKLVEEGKLRKEKPLPTIKEDEKPFELSEGWEWARVGDISKSSEYGTSEKASDLDEVPMLRMNNIQSGKVLLENLKYVPSSILDLPKLYLNTNDLLFNRTNSYELVGKTGVFKGPSQKYTFASYLIRVSFFRQYSNIEFINDYFNSHSCRITQIEPHITQQTGQANFNGTKLMNIVVPIPPLAEQERIVKRVEQLLGWCDALEAQLKSAEEERGRLVESVLALSAVEGLVRVGGYSG